MNAEEKSKMGWSGIPIRKEICDLESVWSLPYKRYKELESERQLLHMRLMKIQHEQDEIRSSNLERAKRRDEACRPHIKLPTRINSGVYDLRNTVTNKCYIGQTTNLEQRSYNHLLNISHGKHDNYNVNCDVKQYGAVFTFEVVEYIQVLNLRETLLDRERYWMRTFEEWGCELYNPLPSDVMVKVTTKSGSQFVARTWRVLCNEFGVTYQGYKRLLSGSMYYHAGLISVQQLTQREAEQYVPLLQDRQIALVSSDAKR